MELRERIDTRMPGVALTASAAVALFVMAHHPTAGGGDFHAFASNVQRMAPLNQAVHGTMIVLVGVLTWTFVVFAMRRGLTGSLVILGLVAWAMGAAAMIAAAVFNGFVVTDIARRALASPESADMLRVTLQGFSSAVRSVEVIGVLGMSAAIFFWSADLAPNAGPARWAGVLGMAAGVGAVAALAAGTASLDVRGMTLVLAAWVLWFLAVGVLMILRKV